MTDEQFRLTPLDVRRWEFGTAIRGYDRARVDEFKARVADELEELTRRINDLDGKARGFHEQLRAFRERDKALNDALVSAQQLRGEIREQADKEGQLLLNEARAEAEKLVNEAKLEAQRTLNEARAEADRVAHEARTEADTLTLGVKARSEQLLREAQGEAERTVRAARDEARMLAESAQAEHQRLAYEVDQLQRTRSSTLGQLKALADRVLADVEAARAVAGLPSSLSPATVGAVAATAPVAATTPAPAAAPAIPPSLTETAMWQVPGLATAPSAEVSTGVVPPPATVETSTVRDDVPALVSPAAAPAPAEDDEESIIEARIRERRTPATKPGRPTPRDTRSQS